MNSEITNGENPIPPISTSVNQNTGMTEEYGLAYKLFRNWWEDLPAVYATPSSMVYPYKATTANTPGFLTSSKVVNDASGEVLLLALNSGVRVYTEVSFV